MPLPDASERELIHTRVIDCHGYRRSDGLWDIEARLVDSKTYGFDNHHRGRVEAGDPVHEMMIRLTLNDGFEIVDVAAETAHGPYEICPRAAPNLSRLTGTTIKRGWNREVRRLVGGAEGCTHLTEMLGRMANTAFQTIYPILAREMADREGEANSEKPSRPALLNTCQALASDSPVVARIWPEHYTGAAEAPKRAS